MTLRQTLKKISIYLFVLLVFLGLFLSFLKYHQYKNYNQANFDEIASGRSRFRYMNSDPCANSIKGDPVDAGDQYFKVNIHCDKGAASYNTLSLKAIEKNTYQEVLTQLSKINGFDISFSGGKIVYLGGLKNDENNKWSCLLSKSEAIDFASRVTPKGRLDCFYNFQEKDLENYYAKKV